MKAFLAICSAAAFPLPMSSLILEARQRAARLKVGMFGFCVEQAAFGMEV